MIAEILDRYAQLITNHENCVRAVLNGACARTALTADEMRLKSRYETGTANKWVDEALAIIAADDRFTTGYLSLDPATRARALIALATELYAAHP